jgi:hypothetical protein
MPLSEGEERILQSLGAAVLLQCNDLPTPIQQQLFEHAVAMAEAGQTAQLKEQIARFLHTHQDDARHRGEAPPAAPPNSSRASSGGLEQLQRLPPVLEDRSRSCQ